MALSKTSNAHARFAKVLFGQTRLKARPKRGVMRPSQFSFTAFLCANDRFVPVYHGAYLLLYLRSFCGAGPSDLHAQITHWRAVLASYKIIGLGGDWIAFALHETSLVQVFDVAGAIVNESSGAVITRGDLVIIFETSAHDIRLSMGEAMCHARGLALASVQPKRISLIARSPKSNPACCSKPKRGPFAPDLAAAVIDRQQPFRTNLDLKWSTSKSTPIVGRESSVKRARIDRRRRSRNCALQVGWRAIPHFARVYASLRCLPFNSAGRHS